MSNLKYLCFQHIKGFNDLSDESKDLFIELYKDHVSNIDLDNRGYFLETKIKSVQINRAGNFMTVFDNGTRVIYTNGYTPDRVYLNTSKAYINQLQDTITQSDLHKLSFDIINILFKTIRILSKSLKYNQKVKIEIIKKASKIGNELSLVKRLVLTGYFDKNALISVIDDAIFFMNNMVLSYYNGRIIYSPEYEDNIMDVVSIYNDYLYDNGFLVETFVSVK